MAVREPLNQRKANLIKKMHDLDEFFLEYINNGKVELAQGTTNPGRFETKGKKPKPTSDHVVFWDRLAQSYANIPVKNVKSIRSLQTVMANSFRSI